MGGGLPKDSPLELRIWALPHFHASDAMNRAKKALSTLIIRDGKPLPPTDPRFFPNATDNLWLREGEPGLINKPDYMQNQVVLRFTESAFASGLGTMDNLNNLQSSLLDLGYETYPSCASKGDKRNWGNF